MAKIVKSNVLSKIKPNRVVFVGAVAVTVVMLVWWYMVSPKSPRNSKAQNTAKTTPSAQVNTPAPKVNYDGSYSGNTDVAEGLANATVSVAGSNLAGTATYKGTFFTLKVSLPATISGTVSSTGAVTATVNVSGSVKGQTVTLTGPATGQITGTTMSGTYSVSGSVGKYSGIITLIKK